MRLRLWFLICVAIGSGYSARAALLSAPSPTPVTGFFANASEPGNDAPGGNALDQNFAFWNLDLGALDPIDVNLRLTSQGITSNTTEYLISNTLTSDDQSLWSGLLIEIIEVTVTPGLDFDTGFIDDASDEPMLGSVPSDDANWQPRSILWTDVSISNPILLTFSLDLPSAGGADDYYDFTLRYTPILIPEPSAAAVLGLMAVLGLRRRRKNA